MAEVQIKADTGRPTGSPASRRLRAAGKVPATLYGHGIDPQSLAVDARELRAALSQEAGLNALLSLDIDGQNHLAMARQLQRDRVRGTIDHVDFVVVRRDEVVAAEVAIHLVGEALQVQREDGLVEQTLFTLMVHAKPADIPPSVEVDVTKMQIGDTIRVGDIALPAGVTTDLEPEEPVVLAQASRMAAEVAEAEAEAEAAAEAAPAEEGAAAPEAAEDQGEGEGTGTSEG